MNAVDDAAAADRAEEEADDDNEEVFAPDGLWSKSADLFVAAMCPGRTGRCP